MRFFYSRFVYKTIDGLPSSPDLQPISSLRNFLFRNLGSSEEEIFDLIRSIDDIGSSTNLHIRNLALTLTLAAIQTSAMLPSEFLAPFEVPYSTQEEEDHNASITATDAGEISIPPKTAVQRLISGFLQLLELRYRGIENSFVPFSPRESEKIFSQSSGETPETIEKLFTEKDFLNARAELWNFLQNYADIDFETLTTFLKNLSAEFSDRINIYKLFDKGILDLFEKKLLEAVKSISLETYRQFFQRNEKEFAFYFLFFRIIRIDQNGIPAIDDACLRELLTFLSGQQKLSENDLYLLIYDTFRSWFCVLREQNNFRRRMRIALPGFLSDDSDISSVFHHDFDFDRFFHKYFSPVIRSLRNSQFPNNDHSVEIVDILSLDSQNMARTIYPERALEPIRRLAALPENEFMLFFRSFLNYENIPVAKRKNGDGDNGGDDDGGDDDGGGRGGDDGGRDDSDALPVMNYLQLTDEEVKELVALQLEKVEAQIRYTTDLALTLRNRKDPLRERCQFLEEIIKCRDFHKLIMWVADPVKFRQEYPQHQKIPQRRIQHEARKMLEMLLFYRKNRFRHAFKKREHWRDLIEQHFMGRLQVQLGLNVTIPVRIKTELDPETEEPKLFLQSDGTLSPCYSYVNLYDCISSPELLHLAQNLDDNIVIEEGAKKFLLYKKEDRNFIAATAFVPLPDSEKPHRIQFWIYNPDGRFMHVKGEESFISSWLRGKTPSDILRNTIVVSQPEDADILRRFHYSSYSSGVGLDTKISDRTAGRESGHARKKTKASKQFSGQRDFSFASYATLLDAAQSEVEAAFVEKDPEKRREKLEELLNKHTHIEYETQIMTFKEIFLALSDYTTLSHSRAYKPKLEWEILFRHYFPPTVYGKKFADDYLSGFRGNGSVE